MNTNDSAAARTPDDFAAVVALKAGDAVKSRLDVLSGSVRRALARAMALDTLVALSADASAVVVISDREGLETELAEAGITARVVPEPPAFEPRAPHGGLNAALDFGSVLLRDEGWPVVLACVGDLPALRPGSLRPVIEQVVGTGRGFVADRSGFGTTVLVARAAPLEPLFGGASARAHQTSGARALAATDDVRSDVDTIGDLRRTLPLGLGDHTAALVARSVEIATALSAAG